MLASLSLFDVLLNKANRSAYRANDHSNHNEVEELELTTCTDAKASNGETYSLGDRVSLDAVVYGKFASRMDNTEP